MQVRYAPPLLLLGLLGCGTDAPSATLQDGLSDGPSALPTAGAAGPSDSAAPMANTPPSPTAPDDATAAAPPPQADMTAPQTSDMASAGSGQPAEKAAVAERDLGLDAPLPGFKRYYAPAEMVPPSVSVDFMQWIDGPLDQDYDVLAISGKQSEGGHHAVVYSFPEAQEVGFSRPFATDDQISASLLGAASTDGSVGIELPDGVAFRAKRGSYLVVQTHYINTTDAPLMGRAVVDLQMAPAEPTRKVAAIFANTGGVSLPPGQQTVVEKYCTVSEDIHIFRSNNHMHDHGVSVTTDIVDLFGTSQRMLKDDPTWNYEWSLNPNFDVYDLQAPLTIRAGETVRTRCTFENATTSQVDFPNEMCVFTGFMVRAAGDLICADGIELSSGFFAF